MIKNFFHEIAVFPFLRDKIIKKEEIQKKTCVIFVMHNAVVKMIFL